MLTAFLKRDVNTGTLIVSDRSRTTCACVSERQGVPAGGTQPGQFAHSDACRSGGAGLAKSGYQVEPAQTAEW